MSQLNHGALSASQHQQQPVVGETPIEELQHVNDDAAAARHLTAIRIRGQLADLEEEVQQG